MPFLPPELEEEPPEEEPEEELPEEEPPDDEEPEEELEDELLLPLLEDDAPPEDEPLQPSKTDAHCAVSAMPFSPLNSRSPQPERLFGSQFSAISR